MGWGFDSLAAHHHSRSQRYRCDLLVFSEVEARGILSGRDSQRPVPRRGSASTARCPLRPLVAPTWPIAGSVGLTASPGTSRSRASRRQPRGSLQDELRAQRGERTEVLRPESRFREAADVGMGKIRERRADSTADTYASF